GAGAGAGAGTTLVDGGAAGAGVGEVTGADPTNGATDSLGRGAGVTCVTMMRLWTRRMSRRRGCWAGSLPVVTVASAGSCPFASCIDSPPSSARKAAADTAATAKAVLARRPRRRSVVLMLRLVGVALALVILAFEAIVVLPTRGAAGARGDGLNRRRRRGGGLDGGRAHNGHRCGSGRGCRRCRRRHRGRGARLRSLAFHAMDGA